MRFFLNVYLSLAFLGFCSVAFAQNEEDNCIIVKASDYATMDEEAAIEYFDSKYSDKKIDSVIDPVVLFSNKKYSFIVNMLTKHHVQPRGYLEYIYPTNFVCGVGMKRQKDVSPACKESQFYSCTSESGNLLEIARLVLEAGEKPEMYLYQRAVQKNDLPLFKMFVENNNNQLPDKETCESLLATAVSYGNYDFVQYFLGKGVSPNAQEGNDFYIIYRAVSYPQIFFMLVDKGADYKIAGYKGLTTLEHAAREGCTEVLNFLLDKEMDPFNNNGNMTAMEMAERYNEKNRKEVVKLFKQYKN